MRGDRRGNTDIVVLDMATGRVRQLTDSNCINTDPSWNPAGTQLAFTSDREGGPQVYLMGDDGSNVRRLTQEGTYNGSPAWSPSGAMVAYVSRFEGKFDLFVYKLEKESPIRSPPAWPVRNRPPGRPTSAGSCSAAAAGAGCSSIPPTSPGTT